MDCGMIEDGSQKKIIPFFFFFFFSNKKKNKMQNQILDYFPKYD